MALNYKWHKQLFGPTAIGVSSSNVVIAEIDLNGNDLLAGSSSDTVYQASIWSLIYTGFSGFYPFNFYHEASIQKRGSTYTAHTFEPVITAGIWVLTLDSAIASTSLYRVRASNTDATIFFAAKVFMDIKMYNV